jgi:hypothetical protein
MDDSYEIEKNELTPREMLYQELIKKLENRTPMFPSYEKLNVYRPMPQSWNKAAAQAGTFYGKMADTSPSEEYYDNLQEEEKRRQTQYNRYYDLQRIGEKDRLEATQALVDLESKDPNSKENEAYKNYIADTFPEFAKSPHFQKMSVEQIKSLYPMWSKTLGGDSSDGLGSSDPNSDESINFREAIKTIYPELAKSKRFDSMSSKDLKSYFPMIGKALDSKNENQGNWSEYTYKDEEGNTRSGMRNTKTGAIRTSGQDFIKEKKEIPKEIAAFDDAVMSAQRATLILKDRVKKWGVRPDVKGGILSSQEAVAAGVEMDGEIQKIGQALSKLHDASNSAMQGEIDFWSNWLKKFRSGINLRARFSKEGEETERRISLEQIQKLYDFLNDKAKMAYTSRGIQNVRPLPNVLNVITPTPQPEPRPRANEVKKPAENMTPEERKIELERLRKKYGQQQQAPSPMNDRGQ